MSPHLSFWYVCPSCLCRTNKQLAGFSADSFCCWETNTVSLLWVDRCPKITIWNKSLIKESITHQWKNKKNKIMHVLIRLLFAPPEYLKWPCAEWPAEVRERHTLVIILLYLFILRWTWCSTVSIVGEIVWTHQRGSLLFISLKSEIGRCSNLLHNLEYNTDGSLLLCPTAFLNRWSKRPHRGKERGIMSFTSLFLEWGVRWDGQQSQLRQPGFWSFLMCSCCTVSSMHLSLQLSICVFEQLSFVTFSFLFLSFSLFALSVHSCEGSLLRNTDCCRAFVPVWPRQEG